MERNAPISTDRELVLQACQGSKEAFEELVDRYQALVLRVALRLTPIHAEAQDLVQDVFLTAYLSLHRLQEPDKFKSWLLGILLNLGKNKLRQMNKQPWQPINQPDDTHILELPDQKPGPDQVVEEQELHRLVLAAIEDLAPKQREPVVMFYFESLSLQEAALLLGISITALKVRLHRARASLRQTLGLHFPELQTTNREIDRRKTMVKVSVADVIKIQDKTVVFLVNETHDRVLPIWIGEYEGASIAMGITGFQTPRPLTYDFIASLLSAAHASLEEVRVESLKSETFYGVAKLRVGEQVKEVDARPSDVLALALRASCPIYVSDEIMEQAGKPALPGMQMPEDLENAEQVPLPTGEGVQTILEDLKVKFLRK